MTTPEIEYTHPMSGPHDTDDGWAELARELGLEQPQPAPKPVEPPPLPPEAVAEFDRPPAPRTAEPTGWDDAPTEDFAGCLVENEDSAEEVEGDDTEVMEDGAEGSGEETGEPGEPKKKRRRRRRRRKKGPGEDQPADAAAGGELVESTESAEDDEPVGEDDESDAPELVGEEAPSPEASRELIANWDVPSWETIISTMLYRPGGR